MNLMVENNYEKKIGEKKGITLIALVVTIVIILILVGISVLTLIGNNGLIDRTTESKKETEEAQERDGVSLAIMSSQMENTESIEVTQNSLEKALKSQFGNQAKFTVTDNGDGSFTVRFNEVNRSYYVKNTGELIENDKILEISSEADLKQFRDNVNKGNTYKGIYVYLTNNIHLNIDEEWETIGMYLASNTSITDKTNKSFCGTFDGKGYIIDGLKITSSNKGKGLFGLVTNGTIKNLRIGENCNINGVGHCSGGICGYAYDGTVIENCYNNASINGNGQQIGGIAGQNCLNSKIINCYNSGSVYASDGIAGGIAGNNPGSINNSCNFGNIKTEGNSAGGISGLMSGVINDCYNIGKVEAVGNYGGGIAGLLYENDTAKICNSYNIGEVISSIGGGIAGGLSQGSIENSFYLEKNVNGDNGLLVKGTYVKNSNELKNCSNLLGTSFRNDPNNMNNGYPVLNWQIK